MCSAFKGPKWPKWHKRYTGLLGRVTYAIRDWKNWEGHIFEAQDVLFPVVNKKLIKKIINYKKIQFKEKKHDFFDLFFWKRVLRGFPVCQRPGTFLTGGINVWTLRRCGSEINFSLYSLQNGARITKFSRIHSGLFLSKNINKQRKSLRM